MTIELHHVIITGKDHPHRGRPGTIPVIDGKVTIAVLPGGTEMVRIDFTDGQDPDACFACRGEFAPAKATP